MILQNIDLWQSWSQQSSSSFFANDVKVVKKAGIEPRQLSDSKMNFLMTKIYSGSFLSSKTVCYLAPSSQFTKPQCKGSLTAAASEKKIAYDKLKSVDGFLPV